MNSVGGNEANVHKQSGSVDLAISTSSSIKSVTARAPLQRTISAGISFTTLQANTAGWPAQAATAFRTAARASAFAFDDSRKHRWFGDGTSTRTLRWCSVARSRNQ